MKKVFSFVVALVMSVSMFADVTYELNGGVVNTDNWTRPSEMFAAFMTDAGVATFETLDYYKAQADPLGAPNICSALTNAAPALTQAKWATLKAYIESVHAAQAGDGASALPADGTGAAWRYAVGAFFVDGQRTGWPKSANFATVGVSSAAWMKAWGCGWANPTSVTEAYTLAEPYKEGFTFDGWYAAADFSGDKVLAIDASTTGTLYAKWIEYINTTAEVAAMADNTPCKVSGVVTYVRSSNVYVQDGFGGMLLYMKKDATIPAVGDKVVVAGTKTTYGDAPEIKDAEVTASEAGTLPTPQVKTLAEIKAKWNELFGMRVLVEGLKICSYDANGNAFVTDRIDTLQCYRMTPDQNTLPVGSKVNVDAIVGYYNKVQFVGPTSGIIAVSPRAVDAYAYPARENDRYTLENEWIYSVVEDNYSDNVPGPSDNVRGMVAKNGKMYFINRNTQSITVVDGKTGMMLDPIAITGEHLFEVEGEDGTYAGVTTLPFNDIKLDGAGHFLIGACLSGAQHFMIYKVDETTGAATLVVDQAMMDIPEIPLNAEGKWSGRFDAFGVYGDVDNNAIIMAADANSFNVFKWTITNGVAGEGEKIDASVDPDNDASLLIKDGAVSVAAFGTAPQIFPMDEDYFYVDGWSTLPMLYDMDGVLADDFIHCPTNVHVVNNPGDTIVMNQGHNGLCEFEVNGEYFLVMAARNTEASNGVASAFALYKFADASKSFDGLEPLWYFPANGMGSLTNGCRTAVPSVEVNQETGEATIYVYTNNNGYGVYTMKVAPKETIDDMWIIGNCATAEWLPGASKKMDKTADGVFEVEETMTGAWLAFVTSIENCTATTTDWDVINAHRFGSNPSGAVLNEGVATEITGVNGDFSFQVPAAGKYKFVVDVNAMTVTATAVAADALEDVDAEANITKLVENGQVYIIKNGVRYTVLGAEVK